MAARKSRSGKPTQSAKKAAKPAGKNGKSPAKPVAARSSAKSGALERSDFMAAAQGEAKTVIYIHGIGNKPMQEVLRCQWDKALFGRGMGERTRLAYWVNRERYPAPEIASCGDRDEGPTLNQAEQRVLSALGVAPTRQALGELVDALADTREESVLMHGMLDELGAKAAPVQGPGKRGLFDKANEIL